MIPMLVAGVDDAGRGAVIGPLVIAGVLTREGDLQKLRELGVRDSKLLSLRRRETLAHRIKNVVLKYAVIKLSPSEIDDVVEHGVRLRRLNWLEAQTMAKIIEELTPDKVYVDASDVLEERFKQQISECMSIDMEIVSEHKADRNHTVVSAASIIAKVERDKEVSDLAKSYGDLGSGYPSDPKTISFLRQCLRKQGDYPGFVRKSWKPAKRILSEGNSNQTKLI
jgi:ribonuclease HII